MKQREIKTRLLLLVSMLILAVGVVPHHHHHPEDAPCFHAVEQEAPSHHDTHPAKPHPCTCIDSFYAADNQGHTHYEPYCNHFPSVDLLADLVTCCLLIPGRIVRFEYPVYLEPLHGIRVLCTSGLRAPPFAA